MRLQETGFIIEDPIDGEEILRRIERAGRTCYKSEDKITSESARAFVRKILASGHESVIEHVSISVRFICDRGLSHEIVRHRLASYSQESTRYCNYSKGKFGNGITLSPMLDGLTREQVERRLALYKHIEQVYLAEIEEGVKPQQARDNLPTCQKTEIVMTCNVREWRWFFIKRAKAGAHPKMIRELAAPLLLAFQRRIPVLFDDIEPDPSASRFRLNYFSILVGLGIVGPDDVTIDSMEKEGA